MRRYNRLRDAFLQVAFGLCAVLLLAWAALAFGSGQGGAGLVGGARRRRFPERSRLRCELGRRFRFVLLPVDRVVQSCADRRPRARHPRRVDQAAQRFRSARRSFPKAAPPTFRREAIERARESCDVSLERVSFSYDEGRAPVISDLSLNVPSGQHLAVLGRSGAGKSTLAALVRGERAPYAGSVLVGGVEASAWGDSISRLVGSSIKGRICSTRRCATIFSSGVLTRRMRS